MGMGFSNKKSKRKVGAVKVGFREYALKLSTLRPLLRSKKQACANVRQGPDQIS